MSRVVVVLIFMLIMAGPAPVRADMVLDWNENALDAIRASSANPPIASRALAITQAAVFDSVNSISPLYTPYKFQLPGYTGASAEAAVAAASFTSLAALFPSQAASLQVKYDASLAGISGTPAAKTLGVQLGTQVANAMLALRAGDGWNVPLNPPYAPTNPPVPGTWQPTPPANAPFLLPQWGYVTPFAMTSNTQFQQPPPPALTSLEYTAAFYQVKALGAVDSAIRTQYQTNTAYFWADGGGTYTPPGHWNAIAQTVAQNKGTSLIENARVFALLNLAEGDAAIAAWYMKLTDNFWRPITAIQNADTDGNLLTIADATWTPLLTTPPFPSCVSGHSTFSGAGAAVLAELFGDNVTFSDTSESANLSGADKTRIFTSFSQAMDQAGFSRILGGIHFQFDNCFGLLAGEELGEYIYANYLQPVPLPAALYLGLGGLGRILLAVRRRRR